MAATEKKSVLPDRVPIKAARKTPSERRLELREALWPGSSTRVWTRHGGTKGFGTIPRLLPLVCVLIRERSQTGDPSPVYWDLWARVFDEGFVQIDDEGECAFSSGYSGARALRTWRERMDTLIELAFIEVQPAGNRKYANVLILNPLSVIATMRQRRRPSVPDEWWAAFLSRAAEIGADIPSP